MVHAGSKIAAAAAALALGTLLAGSAFARSQVVGSFESAMKESQFQGPTSRVYGPIATAGFSSPPITGRAGTGTAGIAAIAKFSKEIPGHASA